MAGRLTRTEALVVCIRRGWPRTWATDAWPVLMNEVFWHSPGSLCARRIGGSHLAAREVTEFELGGAQPCSTCTHGHPLADIHHVVAAADTMLTTAAVGAPARTRTHLLRIAAHHLERTAAVVADQHARDLAEAFEADAARCWTEANMIAASLDVTLAEAAHAYSVSGESQFNAWADTVTAPSAIQRSSAVTRALAALAAPEFSASGGQVAVEVAHAGTDSARKWRAPVSVDGAALVALLRPAGRGVLDGPLHIGWCPDNVLFANGMHTFHQVYGARVHTKHGVCALMPSRVWSKLCSDSMFGPPTNTPTVLANDLRGVDVDLVKLAELVTAMSPSFPTAQATLEVALTLAVE